MQVFSAVHMNAPHIYPCAAPAPSGNGSSTPAAAPTLAATHAHFERLLRACEHRNLQRLRQDSPQEYALVEALWPAVAARIHDKCEVRQWQSVV